MTIANLLLSKLSKVFQLLSSQDTCLSSTPHKHSNWILTLWQEQETKAAACEVNAHRCSGCAHRRPGLSLALSTGPLIHITAVLIWFAREMLINALWEAACDWSPLTASAHSLLLTGRERSTNPSCIRTRIRHILMSHDLPIFKEHNYCRLSHSLALYTWTHSCTCLAHPVYDKKTIKFPHCLVFKD